MGSLISGNDKQHIFIVGAKGIGSYGGYETFVDKLTEYHQDEPELQYHIACKENGEGYMDETKLEGVRRISDKEFIYHNARCYKIHVPQIGPAQAIYYDLASLNESIRYIKENDIMHPIIYILACRIGPFSPHYYKKIHKLGGRLYINPDGHEWMRAKWNKAIRRYWKLSERSMVRNSDLVICDSINIERYIHEQYDGNGIKGSDPTTTYIAYGAETRNSSLRDDDPKLTEWFKAYGLVPNEYYLIVGRFVPENNYETMIREFMSSDTKRALAIVTNTNDKFFHGLNDKLHFEKDERIRFVGTVYDQELLKKIREDAYAYIHGHEVGGTNPSLLEALGSTKLNLLLDVGFNREVAEDTAFYWNKKIGSLKELINKIDNLDILNRDIYWESSKNRIKLKYSWDYIANEYKSEWSKNVKKRSPN